MVKPQHYTPVMWQSKLAWNPGFPENTSLPISMLIGHSLNLLGNHGLSAVPSGQALYDNVYFPPPPTPYCWSTHTAAFIYLFIYLYTIQRHQYLDSSRAPGAVYPSRASFCQAELPQTKDFLTRLAAACRAIALVSLFGKVKRREQQAHMHCKLRGRCTWKTQAEWKRYNAEGL